MARSFALPAFALLAAFAAPVPASAQVSYDQYGRPHVLVQTPYGPRWMDYGTYMRARQRMTGQAQPPRRSPRATPEQVDELLDAIGGGGGRGTASFDDGGARRTEERRRLQRDYDRAASRRRHQDQADESYWRAQGARDRASYYQHLEERRRQQWLGSYPR